MKLLRKITSLVVLASFTSVHGADLSLFSNQIEGKSRYVHKKVDQRIADLKLDTKKLEAAISKSITDTDKQMCEEEIIDNIYQNTKKLSDEFEDDDIDTVLQFARKQNLIDDPVFRILNKMAENYLERKYLRPVSTSNFGNKHSPRNYNVYLTKKQKTVLLSAYEQFSKKRKASRTKPCILKSYKDIVIALTKNDIKINRRKMYAYNSIAYRAKKVSKEEFKLLQALAKSKMEEELDTVSGYIKKKEFVLEKRVVKEIADKSNYMTKETDEKLELSRRERLYTLYKGDQIVVLGPFIESLWKRIDPLNRYDLVGYDENGKEIDNKRQLDSMEMYDIAIALLRSEMDKEQRKVTFGGRPITYEDLVTAAFELGYINAAEVQVIADIEKEWNPEKTWKDNLSDYFLKYAGVLTAVIDPSFSWVVVLGVAWVSNKKEEAKESSKNKLFRLDCR